MPRIPLAGSFYQDSSLQFNAQRSVNMFPEITEEDGGKGNTKLTGIQGLNCFSFSNNSVIGNVTRIIGMHSTTDDRMFYCYYYYSATSFAKIVYLQEVLIDGSIISRSGIGVTEEPEYASMADNGLTLCIVTGDVSFFLDLTDPGASLVPVTDVDYPAYVTDVTFKDTYFIFIAPNEGRFYISTSYATDPSDFINALEFGTVESSPDVLVGVVARTNEILIFGSKTIEPYYNNANVDFPWARNNGGILDIGTLSRLSIATIDNDIIFLGSNKDGYGSVFILKGYTPIRISTAAIERKLRETTDLSNVISYTYQVDGNYFYVMSVPGLDTTLVYDSSTNKWHERAVLNDDGKYEPFPGEFAVFCWGRNFISYTVTFGVNVRNVVLEYVSDKFVANIYNDRSGTVIDKIIPRERTIQHLYNDNKNIKYKQIELDIQKGVGLEDNIEPIIELSMSYDGGMTFSEPQQLSMGKIGEYKRRAIKQRLGIARDVVFRFYSTSPVQHDWIGIILDVQGLND